jgi:hypothetical protein
LCEIFFVGKAFVNITLLKSLSNALCCNLFPHVHELVVRKALDKEIGCSSLLPHINKKSNIICIYFHLFSNDQLEEFSHFEQCFNFEFHNMKFFPSNFLMTLYYGPITYEWSISSIVMRKNIGDKIKMKEIKQVCIDRQMKSIKVVKNSP